jgi:HAD superfamily hydrolase (TIGR01450 family)
VPDAPTFQSLLSFDAVLLDLDGTVYHEDHPLPGAVELIRRLQAANKPFACLTNSTTSPERISQRLARMDLRVDPSHVWSAGAAACDYVLHRFTNPRPRVFNLASDGVQELLEGKVDWVSVDDRADAPPCEAIIVGTPVGEFAGEARQRMALTIARRDRPVLVGCCADRLYPSPRGLEFGSGAFTLMLQYAADAPPAVFCGKPERIFFQELCERLKVDPRRCVLIGDNLESDVRGARGVGMTAIVTLSGITTRAALASAPPELQPHAVVEDLRALL